MLYLEQGRGMTLADTIRASGAKIDVGNNSNPDVVDWNEDGKKDLIIGSESGTGTVRLYLNQGSDANPLFTTYSYIYCGASPINLYRTNPRVCDLDQDGKKDLICGDNYAYLYYYHNEGTNANPVFTVRDTLEYATSGYIHEYYGTRPYFVDYNNDGAIDILTSDYNGYIRYYQNVIFPGVEESGQAVVSKLYLSPSVTRDRVVISYSLNTPAEVRVEVYESNGRLVEVLHNGNMKAGTHDMVWSSQRVSSGIYFITITVDDTPMTRKVIVL